MEFADPQPTTQTQQPSPHHTRPNHFKDEPLGSDEVPVEVILNSFLS